MYGDERSTPRWLQREFLLRRLATSDDEPPLIARQLSEIEQDISTTHPTSAADLLEKALLIAERLTLAVDDPISAAAMQGLLSGLRQQVAGGADKQSSR